MSLAVEGQEIETVVVAIRHPDEASEPAHSLMPSKKDGATESTKTVREELLEIFPALSAAENPTVVVPCASPIRASVQLPVLSALVVAEEKLFETVDEASAVPRNVIAVDVAIWLSAAGLVTVGAAGAVVSGAGAVAVEEVVDALDDEFDEEEEFDGEDEPEEFKLEDCDDESEDDSALGVVGPGPPEPAKGRFGEVLEDFFAG